MAPDGGEQEINGPIPNEIVEVQMDEDNVEVIEVRLDDVMMDIVDEPDLQEELVDIEYVDLQPADAEAVFEFMDVFDDLPQDFDAEVRKYYK